MTDGSVTSPPAQYRDDELVYVDPESRTVIGLVAWSKSGKPLSKAVPHVTETLSGRGKRTFHRTYYPWGTYRSMKRIYKLEGKVKEAEPNRELDEVIPKALKEVYWS